MTLKFSELWTEYRPPTTEVEPRTDERLVRVWVGLIDKDGRELVKRRSVIIKIGVRAELFLEWMARELRPGMATHVGFYVNQGPAPKYTRPFPDCSVLIPDGNYTVAIRLWVHVTSAADLE